MSQLQALHDAALVRALAACQREHIFNITTLEYEKQELKNFLKKLFTCASDNDPAYIKWVCTLFTRVFISTNFDIFLFYFISTDQCPFQTNQTISRYLQVAYILSS